MNFYDEAVDVLETIVKALSGAFSYGSMAAFYDCYQTKALICPEFAKAAVRMKKHIRPPIRAEPFLVQLCKNRTDHITTRFLIQGGFYYEFFHYCCFYDVYSGGCSGCWPGCMGRD